MKKDVLKVTLITGIGLFIAIIGYPFLHEAGHVIASILVGAEVLNITLLPVPSVLCGVADVSTAGVVIIGFAGTAFPLLLSLIIPQRWFISWIVRAILQGISALSLLISCVSVLFSVNQQDDMVQILKSWESGKMEILLILCSVLILTMVIMILDRPGKRISKYFEV